MSERESQAQAEPREEEAAPGEPTLEERLAEAEARAEESRAAFLRAAAELENVRKRAAREVDNARQYGVERFAGELLPVADSLALALDAAGGAEAPTVAAGQPATLRLLQKAFEQAGITELDPAGQPFDPQLHEAMATQPAGDSAPDTVLQVVQKGYLLNGRLLRPARVIVARAAEPAAGDGGAGAGGG